MIVFLTSHPIQYQVPLWQALARSGRVPFEVWFLTDHGVKATHDPGFGRAFGWDLDMLEGYPHRFLDVRKPWDLRRFDGVKLAKALGPQLRGVGARVLWVEGWRHHAAWQAVGEAKKAGLKVWMRGESNDLAPRPLPKWWLKRLILGRHLSKVDRFFCIGSANARLYRLLGVPSERLDRAPYCVDNARFAAQADELRPQRADLRRQWGIPEEALCVLFCGKFVTKKHPLDLAEAGRLYEEERRRHNDRPPLHLLLAGSGELRDELRARCKVLFDAEGGLREGPTGAPMASFAGFLNQRELPRAYVAADGLALPSDTGETWGLVVNEAMASGLPCVASTSCGSCEDLVATLDPQLAFPCGDVHALTRALHRLATQAPAPQRVAEAVARHDLHVTRESIERAWQEEEGHP